MYTSTSQPVDFINIYQDNFIDYNKIYKDKLIDINRIYQDSLIIKDPHVDHLLPGQVIQFLLDGKKLKRKIWNNFIYCVYENGGFFVKAESFQGRSLEAAELLEVDWEIVE